ncbi:MAG: hypothetical protein A2Y61_03000 [Chloroflexi bacterium RBG_13_60_13]|nr:MAG: hypothetical protein A2Y61_03000 [Chloroflexi bacterium RBG_13_60_13]
MPHAKEIRAELRELVDTAHDRELGLYLSHLETHFTEWRNGQIGAGELSDLIHEFHDGWARAVYKTYSILKPDQLVARALGIGLLRPDEVSEVLRQKLSDAIAYFREHYAIDENDPLSKLRT